MSYLVDIREPNTTELWVEGITYFLHYPSRWQAIAEWEREKWKNMCDLNAYFSNKIYWMWPLLCCVVQAIENLMLELYARE